MLITRWNASLIIPRMMRVAGGFPSGTRVSESLKTLGNLPSRLHMPIPKVFRNYLCAYPEIPVLSTDCLSKPDREIEKDGAKHVVVDGDCSLKTSFCVFFRIDSEVFSVNG